MAHGACTSQCGPSVPQREGQLTRTPPPLGFGGPTAAKGSRHFSTSKTGAIVAVFVRGGFTTIDADEL